MANIKLNFTTQIVFSPDFTIENSQQGKYEFRVYSFNALGTMSSGFIRKTFNAQGLSEIPENISGLSFEPVDDKNISPKPMEFKTIKESVSKVTVKKIKDWLRTLDENKWRKTYNIDAKRIAHFVNYGESTELPKSLQRKNNSNTYIREKKIASDYINHLENVVNGSAEKSLREFIKKQIGKLL